MTDSAISLITPDTDTIDQPASFDKDAAGDLYVIYLDGEIYGVTSA